MKKFRLFMMVLFATMFATTQAQTVVDLGKDWDPTTPALLSPTSGATLALSAAVTAYTDTVYSSTNNQVIFSLVNGSATSSVTVKDSKSVYSSSMGGSISYFYVKASQTDYVQVDALSKKITIVKVNGTSDNIYTGCKVAVVYSTATPFDSTIIAGFDTTTLAPCRAGTTGTTFSTTVPSGTKSFRIYRGVYLTASGSSYVLDSATPGTFYGDASRLARIAYIAATLDDASASINSQTDDASKIITKTEYYDLLGKQRSTCPVNTIFIVKKTYEDGSVSFSKTLYKK